MRIYRFLDPRETVASLEKPILDSVNLPFSELPERIYEMPPREQVIRVVGPERLALETADWLNANGRKAILETNFQYAERPDSEIGRLWEPNEFLSEVAPQLPCGQALDLACGKGRDAVFLASLGWEVTGVDILPDALEFARQMQARYASDANPIHWKQLNLEAGVVEFDRRFDLIASFRYLHRPLFQQLPDWLVPGGSALIETFTMLHRERHGKPVRERFVLHPGELPTLLEGLEIRDHSEDWRGEIHTARVWAVKR